MHIGRVMTRTMHAMLMTRRADTPSSKSNTDSVVLGRPFEQRRSVDEDVSKQDFPSF